MSICQLTFTHLNPQRYPKQTKICTWVPLYFEILPSNSSRLLRSNPTPMAWGRAGTPCRSGFITWHDAYTLTHKSSIELRACNSKPSEPFIYWGLKSYRSTFNDISLCKQKHSSPSKKSKPQEKSTKKHYAAFKSTHYDPWVLHQKGYSVLSTIK